jgi:hypothetical protein
LDKRSRRIILSDSDLDFRVQTASPEVADRANLKRIIREDEYRLAFYKRIADICLLTLGIFPDFAAQNYRYPLS